MARRIQVNGPRPYVIRSLRTVLRSMARVSARRARRGPRLPGWNWFVEFATDMMKCQMKTAFALGDIVKARRYLDALVVDCPAVAQVTLSRTDHPDPKGVWCTPKAGCIDATLLYLHGGGYCFYPKSYVSVLALITSATRCRTFALDYRLTPEYRFPMQLDDALQAYRWLLDHGHAADRLVLAGDSAGGNLAMALLLSARELNLPLPVVAVLLSPGVVIESQLGTMASNEAFDYIDRGMVRQWAEWLCDPTQWTNPIVSPVFADLRGLPPLYVQAGGAEILLDPIKAFVEHARQQGADVTLDVWEDMVHDFQVFGEDVPQSMAALKRIGEVVHERLRVSSVEIPIPDRKP